ncbi:hypothetical protein M9Y10_012982 [Tritrichomonas musculus]|uniref:Retinol dehydrogenase n=1 Tax=Tritrichomonas musculus TaxID=1915356 RepID=A0ABR2I5T1_9EUKA
MTLIALITGATGAIGKAIARQIAETGKYSLVLACRNEERAKKAVHDLIKSTNNQNISYKIVDTSSHASIHNLAQSWNGPLHLLMNVAAQTPRKREQTPEGIEMQFATNVLGYYWMIKEFSPFLISTAKSTQTRIVNVASYWAGDVDLDDPQFIKRSYDNDQSYRQSKACDRMLSSAFSEILKDKNVMVNSCHPGDVNSKLSNDLGFGGSESPDEGAATPVYVATSDKLKDVTGKYFEHLHESTCKFSENKDLVKKLMDLCATFP